MKKNFLSFLSTVFIITILCTTIAACGNTGDKSNEPKNTQGLEFFLQEDGTYEVGGGGDGIHKAGTACNLSSIAIPSVFGSVSVVKIKNYAFGNFKKLTRISIPASIRHIGKGAFINCENLTEIKYNGTLAEWENVEKEEDWCKNVSPDCVVKCSDGNVVVN
ncbi:MAG: leucine-rich repeat protein [Clostridia bacterium]|nr:leucine-rich repeat protein [Clostridia bacterium]